MDSFSRRVAMVKKNQPARATDGQSNDDKRFAPRRAGQRPAVVTFDGAMESYACVISDMSSTGARVEMRHKSGNPFMSRWATIDRILLVVRSDRVVYDCKIVRRSENELGLKFMATPQSLDVLSR